MATKRLSRTVLEAGQWARRWHYTKKVSRAERGDARAQSAAARRDPEAAESVVIEPRKPLGKWFASDKLSAAERWLHAQVGRPWAKVHSEMLATFDTRTVAGRHIVFEHMLPSTPHHEDLESGWRVGRRFSFRVDRCGILRAQQRSGFHRDFAAGPRRCTIAWLDGRRIGLRGAHAYWLLPVEQGIELPYRKDRDPRFRQAARLQPDELERLTQLNACERDEFVIAL